MIIGQLVQDVEKDGSWYYGVVVAKYDRITLIRNERGGSTSYTDEDTDLVAGGTVKGITLNGQPVMAKKNIFGRYKFPKH